MWKQELNDFEYLMANVLWANYDKIWILKKELNIGSELDSFTINCGCF